MKHSIAQLDFSHLGELSDNQTLILKIIQTFMHDFTDVGTLLTQSIKDRDFNQALRQVHTLKGAAGNIGAKELNEACFSLEQELKNNENNPDTFNALLQAIENVMTTCDSIVKNQAAQPQGEHDPEAVSRLGAELNALLSLYEPPPDALMQSLQAALPSEAHSNYTTLYQYIDSFDFEQACESLASIVQNFGREKSI